LYSLSETGEDDIVTSNGFHIPWQILGSTFRYFSTTIETTDVSTLFRAHTLGIISQELRTPGLLPTHALLEYRW